MIVLVPRHNGHLFISVRSGPTILTSFSELKYSGRWVCDIDLNINMHTSNGIEDAQGFPTYSKKKRHWPTPPLLTGRWKQGRRICMYWSWGFRIDCRIMNGQYLNDDRSIDWMHPRTANPLSWLINTLVRSRGGKLLYSRAKLSTTITVLHTCSILNMSSLIYL